MQNKLAGSRHSTEVEGEKVGVKYEARAHGTAVEQHTYKKRMGGSWNPMLARMMQSEYHRGLEKREKPEWRAESVVGGCGLIAPGRVGRFELGELREVLC